MGFILKYTIFISLVAWANGFAPLQENSGRFSHVHENLDTSSFPIGLDDLVPQYRIPALLVPTHYKLDIRPVLESTTEDAFKAPATVDITLKCNEATTEITLHSIELVINAGTTVWNIKTPETPITVSGPTEDTTNEVITFTVDTPLFVGETYIIRISYVADIPLPSVRMNGLYRSSYITPEGSSKSLVTTHFSRKNAFRKVVPSYDEPTYKAVFEISIGRLKAGYTSLSNMESTPEDMKDMPDWVWDRYKPTPVMPPTIIAMIVSDFSSKSAEDGLFEKPVKIWGPPSVIANGDADFAAEAVAKTLAIYDKYFEIPYELSKMDSVGIPDFEAGAMENWGLNIYRNMYMFWNKGSTAQAKFSIGNVISHELAHQWWGNLVTHTWWNDWWLTEGFASYFQYRFFAKAYPDFTPFNFILTESIHRAMAFDITPASKPIHGEYTDKFVENPSEINYAKGASLVRMMDGFLSEEVFRRACVFYLKNRKYTSVDQYALFDDLHESLKQQNALPINGKTITEIMDTWTLQTGYPIVRVSKATSTPNLIYFSQESYQQSNKPEDPDKKKSWNVPISYISKSNPSSDENNIMPKVWINKGTSFLTHEFNTMNWILVNPDARGYYRVLYDDHFSALLQAQLAADVKSISEASKTQIVDDYFSSALEGYASMTEAFKMTEFMGQETSYTCWFTYLKYFQKLYTYMLYDPTESDKLKKHILPKMSTVINKIGVEQPTEEPVVSTILRVTLLNWMCSMGDKSCIDYATKLYAAWVLDPTVNPFPVDLRSILYCAVVAKATDEEWTFITTRYAETKDKLLLTNFKCTTVAARLDTLLLDAKDETKVPKTEMWTYFVVVAGNPIGQAAVTKLFDEDLPALVTYSENVNGVADVFKEMAKYVHTTAEIKQLEAILTKYETILAPIKDTLESFLEDLRENRQWLANHGNRMLKVLTPPTS